MRPSPLRARRCPPALTPSAASQGLEHLLTSKEALNAQRAFHAEEKIQKAAAAQTSGPAAAGDSPKKQSDSIVHTVNTEVGVTW